ncbi:hypothetical protein GCM10025857_34700 [Alicyclobacillus contaminans]|nr:hypothetical protein GCM10025857_34700 [Alicyclobacillus contaminans]
MVRRRLVWLNGLTLMALFALLVRVFGATAAAEGSEGASRRWQDTLAGRADLQHFQVLQVDDGRGRIRYRNGLALWDGAVVTEWAGHRWRIHSELPGAVDTLAGRVGKPDVWPNPHRAVAEQGRSGMELTFDAALQSRRPSLVARLRTPEGRVSSDTLYVAHALPGADVRTTLDVGWQRRAEAWLADHRVRDGAVVVLDVATNQMLAAAGVRAGHPDATVAVTPFTPGSIFKLVTGAAALDAYRARPDSVFLCLGGFAPRWCGCTVGGCTGACPSRRPWRNPVIPRLQSWAWRWAGRA